MESYFTELGDFIRGEKERYLEYRRRRLETGPVDYSDIGALFDRLNVKLREFGGVRQNEPVACIKILHVMAPNYFPLLDNPIAKAFSLVRSRTRGNNARRSWRGETLNAEKYLEWMSTIKRYLFGYPRESIRQLEEEFGLSILKLIDEALYVMCSVNLRKRIARTGMLA